MPRTIDIYTAAEVIEMIDAKVKAAGGTQVLGSELGVEPRVLQSKYYRSRKIIQPAQLQMLGLKPAIVYILREVKL